MDCMYAASISNRPEVKKSKDMGLHVDTTAVQWHFSVVLFFKLLFWILILIKFKCLYVVWVQKNFIYEYTRQEQTDRHRYSQFVTTLFNKTVNLSHDFRL